MTSWFITGTDTDIGKTVFTGLFAKYLSDKNRQVVTQKWVQTGFQEQNHDILTHLALMNKPIEDYEPYLKMMIPYAFKLPASAHLAAQQEQKTINPERLLMALRFLEKQFDDVVVEGLGGISVPLTDQLTSLDVLERCKLQTIVVVENKVGAINHALLTLNALAERKIPIAGFVMNHKDVSVKSLILEDNPKIIETFSGCKCLGDITLNKKLVFKSQEIAGFI